MRPACADDSPFIAPMDVGKPLGSVRGNCQSRMESVKRAMLLGIRCAETASAAKRRFMEKSFLRVIVNLDHLRRFHHCTLNGGIGMVSRAGLGKVPREL